MKKKRGQREFLLLDKSALHLLSPEQRKELDSKHTILYPPILFIENARDGLDRPSALFDFENTVSVIYWVQRAKMDLVEGSPSHHYKIGSRTPSRLISEESEADRKKIERQSIDIVKTMENEEKELKNHISLLNGRGIGDAAFIELVMNHRDIPDENLVREFNRRGTQSGRNIPLSSRASLIGRGGRSISEIRSVLDNYRDRCEELCIVDTLEKAYKWVSQNIYCDTESILDFLFKVSIIPLSDDEKTQILNRFRSEGKPSINKFAPYARVATQLYLTIFLYLIEKGKNSSPQGGLRDFEYLYYATDANVTFVSADHWHKKCIERIPLLKDVRKRFVYLIHKDKSKDKWKKGLRSIDITV